jgi:hypothetical protein
MPMVDPMLEDEPQPPTTRECIERLTTDLWRAMEQVAVVEHFRGRWARYASDQPELVDQALWEMEQ